ncbi:MAG: OmpH family outer membrane protein [Saprospiraceae bacterium]
MKAILKVTSLFILLSCMAMTAQAQKFGYLNSASILQDMPQVKQADSQLEALQKQLQKKGQTMVEELQKAYTDAQQKIERGELSPKQQEEESKKLETKQAEIQKYEQDMMKQVQDKRNELMKPILDSINKAIQDVAKESGYTFIFDEGVLLYKEPAGDVTNLVRAKLGMQAAAATNK